MRAEIIDVAGLTARQWGAWSDLTERACVANPFNEPDFVKSAVRGLDERRVGVLAVTDRHGWRAAMPVLRVARWRRVPGRLLVAWRHRYCYLTTPLVDRDDPEAALATLFARGAAEPGTLGLMLDWIDTDGPVGAALEAGVLRARRPLRIDGFERATLERRPNNDYVGQTVSTKRRRELRRLRSRFEDEVGPLMLYDRAGEGDAVAGFLELERSGWKGRAGTAMANSSSHARFFVELCERYAATNRMQLLTLETESATVAMKCNLVAGEGIFCFKIAFDEKFARFSPGVQLELANIDVFHDRKSATWMDSCAVADNAMINRLWSERRTLQSVFIAPHGSRGALGSMLWRAARSAHTAKQRMSTDDTAA